MTKNNTFDITERTRTESGKGFFFVEDDVIARSSVRDSIQGSTQNPLRVRFPEIVYKLLEKY